MNHPWPDLDVFAWSSPLPPLDCHLCLSLSLSLSLSVLPDLMNDFVLIFVSFGVSIDFWDFLWRLEKWEKLVENVFSRTFLGTQPSTWKYISKHFFGMQLNTWKFFLSKKYFHLKIFYTRKTFYVKPNTTLVEFVGVACW